MPVKTQLQAILQHWYWDPVPPWMKLNPQQLEKWSLIEKEFAAKQAALKLQKIEEFEKLTGQKIG